MPAVTEETGVVLRFLAALRRIPLTIVKDSIVPADYSANLRVIRAIACDPYVAGSDIVGEEINDIRDLQPGIRQLTQIARSEPSFVIRIHAGENDSLRNSLAALRQEAEVLRSETAAIRMSPSYRLGCAVTWLPRKVRGGVRCWRENGLRYTVRRFFEHLTGKA